MTWIDIKQDKPKLVLTIRRRTTCLFLPHQITHVQQHLLVTCLLAKGDPEAKVQEELARPQMPLQHTLLLAKNHMRRNPERARLLHQRKGENGTRMAWQMKTVTQY